LEGRRVDPRPGPRAPNRPTTDVHDGQWSQRRPSRGLRTAAGRPEEKSRVGRASQRHRPNLLEEASRPLQRLEKALEQRHVKRTAGVSDLTGLTGMRVVRAIGQGARAPKALAPWRDHRGNERAETIAQALQGTWPPEPLCARRQSLALYA
jgi:transposase